jgi:hypothetical protein
MLMFIFVFSRDNELRGLATETAWATGVDGTEFQTDFRTPDGAVVSFVFFVIFNRHLISPC